MACNRWALGDWGEMLPRPVDKAYVVHATNHRESVVAMQQLPEEFSLQAATPLIAFTRK
jgi:hypothetical protein